jgi:hypothetical protein
MEWIFGTLDPTPILVTAAFFARVPPEALLGGVTIHEIRVGR